MAVTREVTIASIANNAATGYNHVTFTGPQMFSNVVATGCWATDDEVNGLAAGDVVQFAISLGRLVLDPSTKH